MTTAAATSGVERAALASIPAAMPGGLQFVRASGLAQARLQLAILSGDRRRALREIDRLVEIDRQLAHLIEHGTASESELSGELMAAHLVSQRRAISTEKLALGAAIEFPSLPARSESEVLLLGGDDEVTAIEDAAFPRKLALAGMWLIALMVLGTAFAIAVPILVA